DEAGGVASKLALLAQAGANLEYVLTRRQLDKPGSGVLYVAPLTGPVQLRVEGDNEAGLAHRLTQQWALANINLYGLTMSVIGNKFVGYAAFDSVTDANRAAAILGDLGAAR